MGDVMELTFLGTASAYPSPLRCVSCTALQHDGRLFVVDCGEGSQTQIMRSHLRASKIDKIFITHLHGDHLFGLPGLLSTMSHNKDREEPVEIYGPVGLHQFVSTTLALSRAELCFKLIIHELQPLPDQYPPSPEDWPFVTTSTSPFHPSVEEGRTIKADHNSIWHLFSNAKISAKAVWVKHRVPCFSYMFVEADKVGKLDVGKVKSLGLPPGPKYAKLKAGQPVMLDNGVQIKPEDVLGSPIPGRTVVICGDSCDSSQLENVAKDCTVIVHEATLENSLQDQCVENGHSTPDMAAHLAKRLQAKMLILFHFSNRYKPLTAELKDGEKNVQILLDEARQVLPDNRVCLAQDLMVYSVKR